MPNESPALLDQLGELLTLSDAYVIGPSLLVKRYKPKGKIPSNTFFLGMIQDRKVYRAALGMICAGSSIKSAFGSFGIPESHLSNWVYQGCLDLKAEESTYYAGLAADINRVKQIALAEAEMSVKAKDPGRWRRNEARRSWADDDKLPLPNLEELIETNLLGENPYIDENTQALTHTNEDVANMWEAMKTIGLGSNEAINAIVSAAKKQAGEEAPTIEPSE